ncbi:glycosyltransferase family 4 protein [Luteimonas sp. TWI1416]|uniref:glycosyltransferase family 4 protein n=1 Tax=unclassified Luteimonas TaxID=2629088 RepID=UPI003209FE6B
MKHVWILNHYATVPSGVGGTRHYHLAKGLEAAGWRASIIASSVEINSGKQRLSTSERSRTDMIDGIPFLWVRTPDYEGNGGGRIMNMLAYSIGVLKPSVTHALGKPSVIVGSSVHPFAALSGLILSRRFGVPFVFEVRDLWPQTLIDLGRIRKNGAMAIAMRWLERLLYRSATRIVVLLPRAGDYICPLGIEPGRIVWIPNGVDPGLFPPTPHRQRDSRSSFSFMYFGAHGQANALDPLIDAMAILRSRRPSHPIRLRMIGDGPLKAGLIERAAALGLDDSLVSFEDPVPKQDIPQLASQADAFVLSVLDQPDLYRYGISMNKLFDYMASARPIVMASAAVNDPVRESGCGTTVPPGDPLALANAMERMADMPSDALRAMGERGRAHVLENFGFDRLSARFGAILDDTLAPGESAR